jgi:hypothetical protein
MAKLNDIKQVLNNIFVLVDKDTKDERYCFMQEIMNKEDKNYPIYRAISEAQYKSGLTFDFSYEIAVKAVDILSELEDWDDDAIITEAVDSSVPIYTNELMKIYQGNSWAVDEAVDNIGGSGEDSEQRAKYGWYEQIEQMTEAIKANLLELVDDK